MSEFYSALFFLLFCSLLSVFYCMGCNNVVVKKIFGVGFLLLFYAWLPIVVCFFVLFLFFCC